MNSCSVAAEEREKRCDRQKKKREGGREAWTDDGWETRQVAAVKKKKKRRRTRKESTVPFSKNIACYNSGSQFYTFKNPPLWEKGISAMKEGV